MKNQQKIVRIVNSINNYLLVLSITMPLVVAADTGFISESDYFSETTTVISPARLSQPQAEAPVATTIIDRQMIAASGVKEIADIFRLVPGMVVGYETGYLPVVSYHGLSSSYSRRMQILIDGRSVYEPTVGEMMWVSLPLTLDDIERVEVTRGPSAASHGANSFLGVISIITRTAAADKGFTVESTLGNDGIIKGHMRYGFTGEKLSTRVTVEHNRSDGFEQAEDDHEISQFTLRADYRLSNKDNVFLSAGFGRLEGEQGGGDFFPVNTLTRDVNYQHVKWVRNITRGNDVSLQVYHNYLSDGEYFTMSDLYLWDRDSMEQRIDVEAEQTLSIGSASRLVWGLGARRDSMKDNQSFHSTDRYNLDMYRGFAHGETKLTSSTILNMGAMLEKHELTGFELSPRVSINQHVGQNHTVRIAASRAFRNPVLYEEEGRLTLSDIDGNPLFDMASASGGIESEKIDSFELGLFGSYLNKTLTTDIKVFYDKLNKLIRTYYDPTRMLRDFRNSDYANVYGVELQANYQFAPHTRLYLAYGHEKIESDDLDGNYTNSAPEHTLRLLGVHRFKTGTEASFTYYWNDSFTFLGHDVPLERYNRLDLRLAQYIKYKRLDGYVALAIQGVHKDIPVDHQLEGIDVGGTGSIGRRYMATLKLHYF